MLRSGIISSVTVAGIVAVIACSKPKEVTLKLSSNDIEVISLESTSDLLIGEAMGLVNSICRKLGDSTLGIPHADTLVFQGSILKKWDKRLACATVSLINTGSTLANPEGIITILYDSTTSCADTIGIQRKGAIEITYRGLRYAIGSTKVVTYRRYSRAGATIKGNCTLTNLSDSVATDTLFHAFKYSQVVDGGELTLSNGRAITINANVVAEWNRKPNSLPDTIAHYFANGTAHGLMQDSIQYQTVINEDLYFSTPCLFGNSFTPISGIKTLRIGSTIYNLNYQSDLCGNHVTVTVNGLSKAIILN